MPIFTPRVNLDFESDVDDDSDYDPLLVNRSTDGRVYNQPTISEIAALIVGDIDTAEEKDIIMQRQRGSLKRIGEFHSSYLPYQYPLIFPYGEDGYRPNVAHRDLDIFESRQDVKKHTLTWSNAINTSIKYLFNYINRGSDRISVVVIPSAAGGEVNNDEIKQYLDYRYVSPSEACWRTFHILSMEGNWLLKDCFFTWKERTRCTTKTLNKLAMSF
ncbi:hypothetical protein KIW84_075120 [Lathyrus oleraceus]|uniref:Uncharacterized protein n=1 Tax=Pisum sativum TaxID=3888 RepID=A0A9D4VUJ2_PEA|nr:hypothetical protein KIW84_075120 [Pisum sativum]